MSKEINKESYMAKPILAHPFVGYRIGDIIAIDNNLKEVDTTDFSVEDKEFISYIEFLAILIEYYKDVTDHLSSIRFGDKEYPDLYTYTERFISEFDKHIISLLRSHKRPNEEDVLRSFEIFPNEFSVKCVRDIISLYIKNMGLKAVEGSETELTRAFDNETYNSSTKRGFKLEELASDFRNSFGTGEALTLGKKGENQ